MIAGDARTGKFVWNEAEGCAWPYVVEVEIKRGRWRWSEMIAF